MGSSYLIVGATAGMVKQYILDKAQEAQHELILTARTSSKLQKLRDEIFKVYDSLELSSVEKDALKAKVELVELDLEKIETCYPIFEKVMQKHPNISRIAFCAGKSSIRPLRQVREESYREYMRLHAFSFGMLLKALVKYKDPEQAVNIVTIGSVSIYIPADKSSEYTASKGFLVELIDRYAIECLQYKIVMNSIQPAIMHTPMIQEILDTINPNYFEIGKYFFPMSPIPLDSVAAEMTNLLDRDNICNTGVEYELIAGMRR